MSALSLPFLHGLRPLGLLVLRAFAGLILIAHGWPKWQSYGTGEGFLTGGMVEGLGFPMPVVFAWVVVIVEVVGGALLVLGLLTRIWALLAAIDLAVAAFMVQLRQAEPSFAFIFGDRGELELLLMAAGICLLFVGPGSISLDRALGIERERTGYR